jgi:hypothetical protein
MFRLLILWAIILFPTVVLCWQQDDDERGRQAQMLRLDRLSEGEDE